MNAIKLDWTISLGTIVHLMVLCLFALHLHNSLMRRMDEINKTVTKLWDRMFKEET